MWHGWYTRVLIVLVAVGGLVPTSSHAVGEDDSLPQIRPAPAFRFLTQDGIRLSLSHLRGKIVVVTFIYTSCADTCPLLTAKMAGLQNTLGADFGPKVFFVSLTVDAERDTPAVLKRYAQAHGANLAGWAFLTGPPAAIRDVARRYGLYHTKHARGDVDHTFLTSLVDQRGTLRVQYMGVRFDPDELRRDLHRLLQEGQAR